MSRPGEAMAPDRGGEQEAAAVSRAIDRDLAEVTAPESELLLRRLVGMIESGRPRPLSSSVMVNKDEILELLDEVISRLPDELRAARWLLKERDEFLAKTRRDADELIADAKARVAHMVQRTEVVKEAEGHARQVLESARTESRRMRHEVEDYCDQKLASFEIVLERTMRMVQSGREKLAPPDPESIGITSPEPPAEEDEPATDVFDQDLDG